MNFFSLNRDDRNYRNPQAGENVQLLIVSDEQEVSATKNIGPGESQEENAQRYRLIRARVTRGGFVNLAGSLIDNEKVVSYAL